MLSKEELMLTPQTVVLTMIKEFWQRFLQSTQGDLEKSYVSSFHFELTEELANELLDLVLQGKKRATSSSLWSYELEGTPLPKEQDLHIVTDWKGRPYCVIEITGVQILPFKEITFAICQREGEDDSLETWQEGHRIFFEEEGKELGFRFSWDMPVVFEDFRVIYQEQDSVNEG